MFLIFWVIWRTKMTSLPGFLTLYYPNCPGQWFLNLMSNQFNAAKLAALIFTRIFGTHFHQEDKPQTTVNISNRLADLDLNLI